MIIINNINKYTVHIKHVILNHVHAQWNKDTNLPVNHQKCSNSPERFVKRFICM